MQYVQNKVVGEHFNSKRNITTMHKRGKWSSACLLQTSINFMATQKQTLQTEPFLAANPLWSHPSFYSCQFLCVCVCLPDVSDAYWKHDHTGFQREDRCGCWRVLWRKFNWMQVLGQESSGDSAALVCEWERRPNPSAHTHFRIHVHTYALSPVNAHWYWMKWKCIFKLTTEDEKKWLKEFTDKGSFIWQNFMICLYYCSTF